MLVMLTRPGSTQILSSEGGFAMIETIPLLVIFVILISFGLGFFGVIHTAILNSIASRTYAFETFRNRANLYYFRENGSGVSSPKTYHKKQWRFHAVQKEGDERSLFVATTRPITFGRKLDSEGPEGSTHNQKIFDLQARNEKVGVNPAWVMVGYGICLNASCGN